MKTDKQTLLIPIFWLILSIFTVYIYYNGSSSFIWIDIPTHFMGGMLVALIINGKNKITDFNKLFILSLLVFILWEFFEITMATIIPNQFVIDIFSEIPTNRLQDIILDIFGLIFFVLIYKKTDFSYKRKSDIIE